MPLAGNSIGTDRRFLAAQLPDDRGLPPLPVGRRLDHQGAVPPLVPRGLLARPDQGRRPPGHGRHPRERGRAGLLPRRRLPAAPATTRPATPRRRSPAAATGAPATRRPEGESAETAERTPPGMSIAEATATLTAPGQIFEMEELDIRGVPTRTWKNAPATLRAVLELSARPRRQGLPRLRGRADHLRRALPHRLPPWPTPLRRPRSASSRATGWPSPCATCPSGSWPSGPPSPSAPSSYPSTPGGRGAELRLRARATRAPRWSSSTRSASADPPPPGELARPPGRDRRRRATARRRARRSAVIEPPGAEARVPVVPSPRRSATSDEAATPPDVDHRPGRRRHHLLHLGHHRAAQGGGGHPPQHVHQPDEPVLRRHPGPRARRTRRGDPTTPAAATPERQPAVGARSSTPPGATPSWSPTPRPAGSW